MLRHFLEPMLLVYERTDSSELIQVLNQCWIKFMEYEGTCLVKPLVESYARLLKRSKGRTQLRQQAVQAASEFFLFADVSSSKDILLELFEDGEDSSKVMLTSLMKHAWFRRKTLQ